MKKSPSVAPPIKAGFERHQYVFFIDRESYDKYTASGGLLSELLVSHYGISAFHLEPIQDDDKGLAFHFYIDSPIEVV